MRQNEITVTVSGKVGSGKSALVLGLESMLHQQGIEVRYSDQIAARYESSMIGKDWPEELQMYKPSVTLVEVNPNAIPSEETPAGHAYVENECAHKCMDEAGIARSADNGQTYSLWGRIQLLANRK